MQVFNLKRELHKIDLKICCYFDVVDFCVNRKTKSASLLSWKICHNSASYKGKKAIHNFLDSNKMIQYFTVEIIHKGKILGTIPENVWITEITDVIYYLTHLRLYNVFSINSITRTTLVCIFDTIWHDSIRESFYSRNFLKLGSRVFLSNT